MAEALDMREALDRGDVYRRRNIMSFSRTRGNPDRRLAIRIGTSIFREARIPGAMTQLRDIAEGEHSEVALSDKPFINEYTGAVALALQWIPKDAERNTFNLLIVQAWPLSRILGFSGKVTEVMSRSKYRSRPQAVADALARAYREPFDPEGIMNAVPAALRPQ